MIRTSAVLALLVAFWVAPASAQNACIAPLPPLTNVVSTAKTTAIFSDFNAQFAGQPVWTNTEIGIYRKGDNPNTGVPISITPVPKTSWALQVGTTDCYVTPTPFVFGVMPNTEYDLYVRAKTATENGGWGGPVPFGKTGPPAVPTGVRIIP